MFQNRILRLWFELSFHICGETHTRLTILFINWRFLKYYIVTATSPHRLWDLNPVSHIKTTATITRLEDLLSGLRLTTV